MTDRTVYTDYIRRDSNIPNYLPFPTFLLDYDLSMTARVLYALLLNRAQLSARNGWYDKAGRVYLLYPLEKLSEDLHKGSSAVKEALSSLENVQLLERVRRGFGKPNYLYLRIPKTAVDNPAVRQEEKQPSDSRLSGSLTVGKPPPNNYTENQYKNNKKRTARSGSVDYSYEGEDSL